MVLRRVAVTVVAGALVFSAEIGATLSPAAVHRPSRYGSVAKVQPLPRAPQPGEPELPSASRVPWAARSAAVTFIGDYALWSTRRVTTMPAHDMTRRVLGLLEHGGTLGTVDVASAVASVRIARTPGGTYIVTSAIGNFLVGRLRFAVARDFTTGRLATLHPPRGRARLATLAGRTDWRAEGATARSSAA